MAPMTHLNCGPAQGSCMAPQPAEAASRTAPLLCRRRQAQRSSASSTASTSGSGSGSGAVRTAGSTAARLPLSAVLLLAAAAPRAARAQAPTGVTLTRSDANTSVTVSWGYAGSDTTDFIVKAEPYVFQDSFNGGIKPGWVWDAPCNPSNTASGTCTYSTSVYQGLVAIGVSAGVGFGYASGRGSTPELLRPEVFDARSDFCANVYADNKLVNLGYVANVQGGIVVSDADTGLPIFSRWITTWDGAPGRIWRESKCNGLNINPGTPLDVPSTSGGGYVGVCWNAAERVFYTYAKNNVNDPWTLEGSGWSGLAMDGSTTIYGARHPRRWRIGLMMQAWGTISTRRYIGFRDFELRFGVSSLLAATDDTSRAYPTYVRGGTGNRVTIATPAYTPYGFSVAVRSPQGVQLGPWVGPADGASAWTTLPAAALPLATTPSVHWDFASERPGTLALVRDSAPAPNNNPLVQGTAATRPRVTGGVLGPWSAWTARGDAFTDAVPYTGASISGGRTYSSQAALLNVDPASEWVLVVVMRPSGAPTGGTYDVINKGPSTGDTTRPGWYVSARSNAGAPSVSMVVRARGGSPDSVNSAGVSRVNTTVSSVEVLVFRSHARDQVACWGRSLEGYAAGWDAYPVGPNGTDASAVSAWPVPTAPGVAITPGLPRWAAGAPDSDSDAWWRAAVEAAGGAAGVNCNPAGGWTLQAPANADRVRLGASSPYSGNGATNRLVGDVFEVLLLQGNSSTATSGAVTATGAAALLAYYSAKYYVTCPAAAGSNPTVSVDQPALCAGNGTAPPDATCQLACADPVNTVVLSGAPNITCQGGRWRSAATGASGAVCRPTCPTLPQPPGVGACTHLRWLDSFAGRGAGDSLAGGFDLAPYTVFPYTVPSAYAPRHFYVANSTGAPGGGYLVADGSLRRHLSPTGTGPVVLYASSPAWVGQVTPTTPVTVSAAVQLLSGPTGLALRVTEDQGSLTYYRLLVSPSSFLGSGDASLSLERVVRGASVAVVGSVTDTVLLTPLLAGAWVNVSLSLAGGSSLVAAVNGVALLTRTDPAGLLPHGSAGIVSAGGVARLRNFAVSTACAAGGNVTRAVAGFGGVVHTCLPGYVATGGNATRECLPSAAWSGSPVVCTPVLPIFNTSSLAHTVPENSPAGIVVGRVVATAPALSLIFTINSGNTEAAFAIDPCSGTLTVKTPVLDYETPGRNAYTLNVSATAIDDSTATSWALVTVTVTNVNEPPTCAVAVSTGAISELATAGTLVTRPGAGGVALLVTAVDPENDPGNWTIAYGNGAGLFELVPQPGGLAVTVRLTRDSDGRSPTALDFESRPTLSLTLSVTDPVDAKMADFCSVVINVIDEWEPPVMPAGQLLTVDEVAAYSATTAAPAPANPAVIAVDPDAGDTVTFSLGAVSGGLLSDGSSPALTPTQASALLSINPSTGVLSLRSSVIPASPTSTRIVGSYLTRAAYTVWVTAVDPHGRSATTNVSLLVLVGGSSGPGAPVLSGVSPNTDLPTGNATALVVTGDNFGTAFNASGGPPVIVLTYGPYTATGCALVTPGDGSPTTIGCTSVPGVGWGHAVFLTVNGVPVRPSTRLVISYAAPTVTGITGTDPWSTSVSNVTASTTAASTAGGETFWLLGSSLGVGGSCAGVSLTYGPPGSEGAYTVLPTECTPTTVRFPSAEGLGAGHVLRITVGGQSGSSSGVTLSYGLPGVTSAAVPQGALYTTSTLPTVGAGADVVLYGANFGPLYDTNGSALSPVVTAGYSADASRGVYTLQNCRRGAGAAAHSMLVCTMPPGVGAGLRPAVRLVDRQGAAATAPGAWLSYRPPVVAAITGPGATRAATAGGDVINVLGAGFGSAAENGAAVVADPANPRSDRGRGFLAYARTSDGRRYEGVSCVVADDAHLSCLAAEGTGSNYSWELSIAGQPADGMTDLPPQSYAQPMVYAFYGDGAVDADSRGGQVVVVRGGNFGASWANVTASALYTWTPAAAVGGAAAPARSPVNYTAALCNVTVPHVELTCLTAPGVGKGLMWTVAVDGLVSSVATTAYGRPFVANVTLGTTGLPVTDGQSGQLVTLTGLNFGADLSLVDYVRYGPYIAANLTLRSHTELTFLLGPGIGSWPVTVSVAGQVSDPSSQQLAYARPAVRSVLPRRVATDVPWGTEVVVTGTSFGLDDPSSSVGVLLGNPADGTLTALLSPSSGTINADGSQSIAFRVPQGLGPNRAVRVAAYLRGTAPTSANLLALSRPDADTTAYSPSLGDVPAASVEYVTGAGSFLSYAPPQLDSLAVSSPSSAADLALLAARGVECNATGDCGAYVKLQLVGTNMGPPQEASLDSVRRNLVFGALPPDGSEDPTMFTADVTGTIIVTWTHRNVVAFVRRRSAQVAVQLLSQSWGATEQTTLSNVLVYRTLSPSITGVIGHTTGVRTTGGGTNASELVGVSMANMAAGSPLRVTVGGTVATMYAAPGDAAAGSPPLTPDSAGALVSLEGRVTVYIVVPPGEGSGVPIVAQRLDGDGQWKSSVADASATISYAPPTVTAAGVQRTAAPLTDAAALDPSNYAVRPVATGDRLGGPTDGSRFALLQGVNFGLCPVVAVGGAVVRFCADNATGASATPGAVRTHTALAFPLPQGEGMSLPLTLTVGGQAATGLLFFDYDAPVLTGARAETDGDGLPPGGGTRVLLTGRNLGAPMPRAPGDAAGTNAYVTPSWRDDLADPLPPRVRIRLFSPLDVPTAAAYGGAPASGGGTFAPSADGYVVCPDVRRINHTALSCLLPRGDGARLDVEVMRSGDTGAAVSAGVLSYDAPLVTAFVCDGCHLMEDPASAGTGGSGSGSGGADVNATATPSPVPSANDVYAGNSTDGMTVSRNGSLPLVVAAAPRGGATLTLFVANLGAPLASLGADGNTRYCVFLVSRALAAALVAPSTTAPPPPLRCNGVLDSVGEGELEPTRVLTRNATHLVLTVPPGLGRRALVVASNGGTSDLRSTPLEYLPPFVGEMAPARVGTDGGDSVTLRGAGFGSRQLDTSGGQLAPFPPAGLPLAQAPSMPVACLRVEMHRSCVTDCRAPDGSTPPAVAACSFGIARHTDGDLVLTSSPGIGLRRNVTVTVIDIDAAGATAAGTGPAAIVSNVLPFDFLPPSVTLVDPTTVLIRAVDATDPASASTRVSLKVYGANMGRADTPDYALWTADERRVGLSLGTTAGLDTVRSGSGSGDDMRPFLQGSFPVAALLVGRTNITVTVAGQTATLPPSDPAAPVVACAVGFTGKPGQSCLACPVGATCAGYDPMIADEWSRFVDPVPIPGFFNLNGTMRSACPAAFSVAGRGWCIAPCEPREACSGDNFCAYGYASIAPAYRCANCAPGFFKRGGSCAKCPDSPAGVFIGFILLIIVIGGLGFLLNKKQVNLAVVSIGVDYLQVLAIFSQVRVTWPPAVRELLTALSAFNLNIEIVAPECLVPDVSYKTKWAFILAIPPALGLLFLVFYSILLGWKALFLHAPKSKWHSHLPALVQSEMILLFFLYLYQARTLLEVFNCSPTVPPDGKQYLQAVFEECGVPGGTQLTLLPWAIVGLLVYSFGYPALLLSHLWRNKERVMEDQLLRAKGVGDDRLTNPHAFEFRRMWSRSYFQFKPDYFLWIGIVLGRKFAIAVVAVIVNRSGSFQMAAALLVLFIAYALQVRFAPYMSPSDYEATLKAHDAAADSGNSAVHARLRATLQYIESRGRKKTHRNILRADGRVDTSAVVSAVSAWLLNYNTVEAILLFCGVIVCLMAILYESEGVLYYPGAVDTVTAVLLTVISLSIVYYAIVVLTEAVVLFDAAAARRKRMASRKGKALDSKSPTTPGGSHLRPGSSRMSGRFEPGAVETAMNPVFVSSAVAKLKSDAGVSHRSGWAGAPPASFAETVAVMQANDEPPPLEQWEPLREQVTQMFLSLQEAQASAARGPGDGLDAFASPKRSSFAPVSKRGGR